MKGGRHVPANGSVRRAFERACEEAGGREADVLAGRGGYVPTAPEFANVDFLTLAARLDRLGRVPDILLGALRLIRTLDTPRDILWIFVRAYRPMMEEFVVARPVMYTDSQLPLPA